MASEPTAKLTYATDLKARDVIEKKEFKPCWTKQFPVIGKGTLLFNIARNKPFYITVRGHDHTHYTDSWIALTVTKDRVSFLDKYTTKIQQCCVKILHYYAQVDALQATSLAAMWALNQTINARIGLAMIEITW